MFDLDPSDGINAPFCSLIQLGQFVCIMLTLWTMTVSTYGDPSQLNVLPLAADVALFFSSFTVFIVQVSDFECILFIWCLLGGVSHFMHFDFGS
jgi:hypothetical protein